jgi:hypothetical protein
MTNEEQQCEKSDEPKPKAQNFAEWLAEIERRAQQEVDVSLAACSLALRRHELRSIPKKPKRWTGMLAKPKRSWYGRLIILPDGVIGKLYGVLRGAALVWRPAPFAVGEQLLEKYTIDQLRLYKMPSAVVLGRRKRGKKERPSELKARTARKNGRCPCRPGRQRGRPKISSNAQLQKPPPSICPNPTVYSGLNLRFS